MKINHSIFFFFFAKRGVVEKYIKAVVIQNGACLAFASNELHFYKMYIKIFFNILNEIHSGNVR